MKLINAIKNNKLKLVSKLIKEGHPLNNKDEYESNALMYASYEGNVKIIKELINAGVSLNDVDNYGWTALMEACYKGHKDIVNELIKAGATLNDKDKFGEHSLRLASCKEIAINLIKAGASLTETDNYGRTVLDYHKDMWRSFDIQYLILSMYPDKYKFLEEKIGINKDILLRLKMEQILSI